MRSTAARPRPIYDVQDHLIEVTDAEGNETSYVYSDRDLMTRQDSVVSGQITYAYNGHGQLTQESDARPVTVQRQLDALDRVTLVDYPTASLDTSYVYDDPGVSFSKGRLTEVLRNGVSIETTYDRFGRILQDGAMTYGYDNGNRTSTAYPGLVTATTAFDFADRAVGLTVDDAGTARPWVSGATYKPFGPLAGLCLANQQQPRWNWPDFGRKKDCGECFRECKLADGNWPFYKCPLP